MRSLILDFDLRIKISELLEFENKFQIQNNINK